MSITDELREYARGCAGGMGGDALRHIADRIDAEHEAACAEAYGNGVMSVPIALDESQWVKLPVDADGEVWHVGDFVVGEVNPRNPKAIERMLWYGPDSGWQLETDTIIYPCPDRPRHYHAPTVEDVLREMLEQAVGYSDAHTTVALNAIAEYSAKLRLAGDGEEQ